MSAKYIGVTVSPENTLSEDIKVHLEKCEGLTVEVIYEKIFRYAGSTLFSATVIGR